jgi:PAS domain S-box-containing protein
MQRTIAEPNGTGMFIAPLENESIASFGDAVSMNSSLVQFPTSSASSSRPVALTRPALPASGTAPLKILIVDDHPENLLALEASLGRSARGPNGGQESINVDFVRANSGREALRKVLLEDFAVILLDVQMPEMDGYETAELIRKRPQSQFTPIIFLTAVSTSEVNIFRGYSLGAVDYITKPFDPSVLRAKVSVFVELYRKQLEIQRMADALREQAVLLRNSNAKLEEKSHDLSKERDFVDKILETAGSYIIIFDSNGRLERFNNASEQISGLRLDHAKGRLAWEILVSGEDADKVRQAFEVVRKGEEIAFEMNINPAKGKARRLSMSFKGLFDESGKLLHVIASGIDISERYEIEERTRQLNQELEARVKQRTQELETANRELWNAKETAELANSAKDKFLAVLSHELRTPLTPVLAIVQMLDEDPVVSSEVKSWIETIGRNVQLEARLIDDLLDLTRIANGKLELHLGTVDLHKLLHNTIEICGEEIRAKKLELSLKLEAAEPLVEADSARMHQVLWNLLKNAVKFTPEGGSISIRTSNPSAGMLRCQIKDNGIGISKEHLGTVFNAFDQGSKAITRRFGGLGLGLAISKALIDQHRGSIWAESEGAEKGALFTIEIPTVAKPKGEKPPQKDSGNPTPERRSQILLVEDNNDTSRAMQVLLERKGYTVTIARSVEAALEQSREKTFDLVVSDIGLPDGDGFEVIQRMNEIRPTRGVAISGFGMDEDRRRSIEAGFNAHLVKPVNFDELSRIVRKLLTEA